MKIRFLTSVAGARFAYRPGEEPELRDDIAREFIAAGQAVAVEGAPDVDERHIFGLRVPGTRRRRGAASVETHLATDAEQRA